MGSWPSGAGEWAELVVVLKSLREKGLWNCDASSPRGVCEIQTPVSLAARETQASYLGGETPGGG